MGAKATRGYFGIGVYRPKTETNMGTLWRSAHQLGAAFIFAIGKRYDPHTQHGDTCKAFRHIPLHYYDAMANLSVPRDCQLIGIEMGGEPLRAFSHPARCIYLLGAEDDGLPPDVQAMCNHVISLDSIRQNSFNVHVAGSIVMYDRLMKSTRGDHE